MSREETYGYFPGGDMDARLFRPDIEVNTTIEIEAHRQACDARDRGEHPVVPTSGRVEDITIPAAPERVTAGGRVLPAHEEISGPALVCGSAFGMGTYEIEVDEPDPGAEEDVPGLEIAIARVA